MKPWQLLEAKASVAEKLERDAHDYESWIDAACAWELAGDYEKASECYQMAWEWARFGTETLPVGTETFGERR